MSDIRGNFANNVLVQIRYKILKKMSVKQLKAKCKKKIRGYSKLNKKELINLLKKYPNIPEKHIYKKKVKVKNKSINLKDVDINKPKIIEIFYNKYIKAENDKLNKLREKIVAEIINNNDYYKIFKDTEYFSKFTTLSIGLKREISRYSKGYKMINVQIKAGRGFNYDFLFKYLRDKETVDEIKVEFKYGITTLTKYPEIYSKYTKGASIFNNKDYIEFFYLKIDDFIETFPDEISEKLKKYKPSLIKYKKIINDAKYKHSFQNIIYKYDKQMKDKKNLKHKRFVNNTIKDFLKSITDVDINFKKWREELVSKQKDKYFLLCKDGIWYTERLTKEIMITKEWKIKNGNMIVFECENPQYQLQCLLRWKNHKGCAGPAWQVKLHKKRLKK
jgi:hypothetical protein|tara:strand:+ start:3417 stop:4583 length:1167 start_codon:yes stop_codon:yes gene_type:complete